VAKIDMRLVPDMTALGTLDLLKKHLAKAGFGDIEVNMSGGYDPTETDPSSKLIQAQIASYRKTGVESQLWPRLAGSWPGVTFTGAPLKLPAGHYGLGLWGWCTRAG
jgi:acetylornithine deacetylase/succinyl-diaminopimelate desuccinylase-like protein